MSATLDQVLGLVGKLDDSPGEDTARERFRRFLRENVKEVGQVRDYIEDCLRKTGDQYNRALQDLVNHLGQLMGFEVTFGRYHGLPGEIGFDGHWRSPTGFHLVVEVKTTEAYAFKAATLVGYVDRLISEKKIPNWDVALGLYVVGRPDPEVRDMRLHRIFQISSAPVELLLLLAAGFSSAADIVHQDVLAVLRSPGPTIDPLVKLMSRLAAQAPPGPEPKPPELPGKEPPEATEAAYWMTPVKADEEQTAEEVIGTLVGQEQVYAWADRTPGRRDLKPGDWLCFYAAGNGVIAHAKAVTRPEERTHRKVRNPDKYRWVFNLGEPALYIDRSVVIDAALRAELDAFEGRPPTQTWAWFVQVTRKLSKHDFMYLTRQTRGAGAS